MKFSFVFLAMILCSFQCSGVFEEDYPEIVLYDEVDDLVLEVHHESDSFPPSIIYFDVLRLTDNGKVWAECPDGVLDVMVSPSCKGFLLTVTAKTEFSSSSLVRIIAEESGRSDKLEISVKLAEI